MADYLLVNRCAVSIQPKAPFWDWMNKTSELDMPFILEKAPDCNMYLVPDYESEENIRSAIEQYLQGNFEDIFTSELEAWNMDPSTFPEISYDRFNEWFNVHIHTMIFDTLKKPLKRQ